MLVEEPLEDGKMFGEQSIGRDQVQKAEGREGEGEAGPDIAKWQR
jgi:hypothetical protein